jgi:hypothetical protein
MSAAAGGEVLVPPRSALARLTIGSAYNDGEIEPPDAPVHVWGRTADGRCTIDVREFTAVTGISPATARRHVCAWWRIRSIQPTGENGRVYIPVHAVLAELGIAHASAHDLDAGDAS